MNQLILIAEDNPTNQVLIKYQLEKLGFKFHFVSSGQEALQFLSQQKCDLILMDCQMLGMDGYQTAAVIRETDKKIPIIAISAADKNEEKNKYLDHGMNDYLEKPFQRDELKALLLKWLQATSGIDWSQLESLEKKTNPLVIKKLIDSFLVTLPEIVKELDRAQKNKDLKKIYFFSHKLNASCGVVGATELLRLCKEIEEKSMLPETSIDALKEPLHRLKQEALTVEAAFKQRAADPA